MIFFTFSSAATLQEELEKKTATLSESRQQLERYEQEKAALQGNLNKLTQEGQARQAELDRKAQGLASDLQKAQQEKETQGKELAATKDSLAKANKALKESQSQLDKERKSAKAAMDEKVGSGSWKVIEVPLSVKLVLRQGVTKRYDSTSALRR